MNTFDITLEKSRSLGKALAQLEEAVRLLEKAQFDFNSYSEQRDTFVTSVKEFLQEEDEKCKQSIAQFQETVDGLA